MNNYLFSQKNRNYLFSPHKKKFEIIYFFRYLILCFHMISEIIQSVGYESYDNSHHVHFIFSQKFVSLFWGLFDDEIDIRVNVGTLQTT
jgi:hypothetical protein